MGSEVLPPDVTTACDPRIFTRFLGVSGCFLYKLVKRWHSASEQYIDGQRSREKDGERIHETGHFKTYFLRCISVAGFFF